eukprot:CAMPEP_0115726326 /NCGR_PEP_ID=MMETSP0272-20121206/81799_1 /TAXON_ID=71861 /ORGANISM="Scrippsiella trochoidea, Strain CCMP3099" /LENGTH=52 /DNA_ID=CAMNT_0003169703 /DNA_START=57 /DNA_END=212 /DNA_ORIENTATION=+
MSRLSRSWAARQAQSARPLSPETHLDELTAAEPPTAAAAAQALAACHGAVPC